MDFPPDTGKWTEWDIRVLLWDIRVLFWVDFGHFGKTPLYWRLSDGDIGHEFFDILSVAWR